MYQLSRFQLVSGTRRAVAATLLAAGLAGGAASTVALTSTVAVGTAASQAAHARNAAAAQPLGFGWEGSSTSPTASPTDSPAQ
jgi:hypothetical protein